MPLHHSQIRIVIKVEWRETNHSLERERKPWHKVQKIIYWVDGGLFKGEGESSLWLTVLLERSPSSSSAFPMAQVLIKLIDYWLFVDGQQLDWLVMNFSLLSGDWFGPLDRALHRLSGTHHVLLFPWLGFNCLPNGSHWAASFWYTARRCRHYTYLSLADPKRIRPAPLAVDCY